MQTQIIRIFNECKVWIEISIPRVTVQLALYGGTVIPRDRNFSSDQKHNYGLIIMYTLPSSIAFSFKNILSI